MRIIIITTIIFLSFLGLSSKSQATLIEVTLTEMVEKQWEIEYRVSNDTLSVPIRGLTFWFVTEQDPRIKIVTRDEVKSAWDEAIIRNVEGQGDGYDLLAISDGIIPGSTVEGFAVQIFWTGSEPGSQYFEILNPDTYEVIDAGYTILIPEPVSVCLFGTGAMFLWRRRHH